MSNQGDVTLRKILQEIEIIHLLLTSLEPDLNREGVSRLSILIEAFRDSAAVRTAKGEQLCDLLIRSRKNLRIGCFGDALGFLMEARDLAAIGSPTGGEKAAGSFGEDVKRGLGNTTPATVDEIKLVLQNLHQDRREAIATAEADFIKTEIELVEKALTAAKEVAAKEKAEQA